MWRALCVDDNEGLAQQIADFLEEWKRGNPYEGGFSVQIETRFDRALDRLKSEHFDLVTLDLHGAEDPDPMRAADGGNEQVGRKILEELKRTRVIPIIFYTGFAEKIANIESGVVRVVKKGSDDMARVRAAAVALFDTGLPSFMRRLEEEQRQYIWDIVDARWSEISKSTEKSDLAYLLARRLAFRFGREMVKEMLGHKAGASRPIEQYIYPPISSKIWTGAVLRQKGGEQYFVVATPACDFEQDKAAFVTLVGTSPLEKNERYREWERTGRWDGMAAGASGSAKDARNKLLALMRNGAGERFWFLPKTFFVPSLIADFQDLTRIKLDELESSEFVCRIDSPFREQFILNLSRYYGRFGTPDFDADAFTSAL